MKKLALILLAVLAASVTRAGAQVTSTGNVRVIVTNSDGTYNEVPLAYASSKLISFGASAGTFTTVDPTTFATTSQLAAVSAATPDYRTNSFSVAAALTTKTITYTTPFTTGTAWNVVVNPSNLVTGYSITNSTANGFTVTFPTALLGGGTMTFIAVPLVSGKN